MLGFKDLQSKIKDYPIPLNHPLRKLLGKLPASCSYYLLPHLPSYFPLGTEGTTIGDTPLLNLASKTGKSKKAWEAVVANEITHTLMAHDKNLDLALKTPKSFSGFSFSKKLFQGVNIGNSVQVNEFLSDVISVNVYPDYIFNELLSQIFTLPFAKFAAKEDGQPYDQPEYELTNNMLEAYLKKTFPKFNGKIQQMTSWINNADVKKLIEFAKKERNLILSLDVVAAEMLDDLKAGARQGDKKSIAILKKLIITSASVAFAHAIFVSDKKNAKKIKAEVPALFMQAGKELVAYGRNYGKKYAKKIQQQP